jgi:hypothetical protein
VTATYAPNANYTGSDSFTFKAYDGGLDSNIATVSLTIGAVNDMPTADSQTLNTMEDTALLIGLSAVDIDSAGLIFSIVANPVNGILGTLSASNCVASGLGSNCSATVTYTPAANYNGPDSFTFKVSDGTLDSTVSTVSISIVPVNDPPVVTNGTALTNEDKPVLITLGATDIDSATLTFSIVGGPGYGSLGTMGPPLCTNVPNGTGTPGAYCTASLTYTPHANFGGADSFTFKVNDGSSDSNLGTVALTVNAINDAPLAANDFYSTDINSPLTLSAPGVLANDNDLDSPTTGLTVVLVIAPSNAASFTLNPNGSLSYTPAANFVGTDRFTYKINDGANDSNEATVTVAVLPANDALVAINDFYSTERDTALSVEASGVLANDNGIDTAAANSTAILDTGPTHALSFTLNPDGSFEYVAQANFIGNDSFSYKFNDGSADSNVAMVTIAVMAPNTFPVAKNDSESTHEDAARSIPAPGVLGNDSIALMSNSTAVLISSPRHALSFTLNADGSFNYTPQNEYNRTDSFSYRLYDGTNFSNVAMVNIEVVPVNDLPVAQAQSVSTNQNTPVIVTLTASDIDHKTLTLNVATQPTSGTLGNIGAAKCTVQGQGVTCTATVSYQPAANYVGADSFTFTASDGVGVSAAATVSINVLLVNRPPTANAGGPYIGTVGIPVQFSGMGNDADGNPISLSWTFGDGGKGTGTSPSHTYTAPGAYPVVLTVTDTINSSAI